MVALALEVWNPLCCSCCISRLARRIPVSSICWQFSDGEVARKPVSSFEQQCSKVTLANLLVGPFGSQSEVPLPCAS